MNMFDYSRFEKQHNIYLFQYSNNVYIFDII